MILWTNNFFIADKFYRAVDETYKKFVLKYNGVTRYLDEVRFIDFTIREAGFSISSQNCAYCATYLLRNCEGCPIKNYTGRANCSDTPYHNVSDLYIRIGFHDFFTVRNDIFLLRDAVIEEIEFLLKVMGVEYETK